jgi:N6-adenosine-specific RNA methylase IME4
MSISKTSSKAIARLDQVAVSWAERLNKHWQALREATVEGFISLGKALIAAKDDVGHGGFGKWCEANLEFSWDTANALMAIARWVVQIPTHARNLLPPDWTTLRRLARLDDDVLEGLFKDGTIHPNASRRDIEHKIKLKQRTERHKEIAEHAKFAAEAQVKEGQFALIYADPAWEFKTYRDKGQDLTPAQHYPTMSDEEIARLEVFDVEIQHLAAKDAVCLLWCTSANLKRAIAVLEAWGFEYKTHFVWDKQRTGTGYICLNQHEVLLYGTRGKPPLPMKIFSSLISAPRGKHSEKPAIVRDMIAQMFPAFDANSRIELFYRGPKLDGWTVWGLEALSLQRVA